MNRPSRNPTFDLTIGQFMKEKRVGSHLKQEEIAEYLGVSQETISLIEQGKVKISLTDFVRFAKRYAHEIKIEVPRKYKKLRYIMLTLKNGTLNALKYLTNHEIQTEFLTTPLFIPSNNP